MKGDRKPDDEAVETTLDDELSEFLETTLDDKLSEFLGRTRRLVEMPEERTVADHLSAIVAASRTATDLVAPPIRRSLMDRTKPVVAKLALAVSLLTGGTAGLAYAGVDLPGSAAENAFQAVGLHLPNQGESNVKADGGEKSVADDVRAVIEGTEERNCEFGQAVSEAASANATGEQPEPTHDPCAEASPSPQGSRATGETRSSEGKAKAEEGKTTGETKSEKGKAKADEAGSDPQGSKSTGETKSEEGKSGSDRAEDRRPAQGSGQEPTDVPSP